MGAEDDQHVQQQVAEVAGVQGLQPLLILRVELGAAAGGECLGLAGVDLGGVQPRFFQRSINPASWRAGQRFSSRLRRLDQLLEDAELVVGVEDGEIGLQADQLGMAAEHARGDRVEGAEPRHAFDRAARNGRDARLHFARGLVGEGDGEDLARPGFASRDQMGEPRSQRGGLAGTGAGEHEHRALGRQYRLALWRD